MTDQTPARYEQVIEGTPYCVIAADETGHITVWNRAAEAALGHAASEALGQPLSLIIPGSMQAAHAGCYAKAMAGTGGRSRARESTLPAVHRDGRTIQLRGYLTVLATPEGKVSGASIILRPVEGES